MQRTTNTRWWVLLAVMLAFFPIVLDMTILHVTIPSLSLALQASSTELLWVIDIYPLLMAGLLIPMGTLADRIGHRRLLCSGLVIFTAGSALAAFSPTVHALIGARAVMAVGSAMVMPCTLAIVRQTFTDERERALALGLWATVGSAGAAVGPLIGGALLEHFWWGSVFLVNLPVMLFVLPLVVWLAPRSAIRTQGPWPYGQALVLTAGLMACVYGVKSGAGAQGFGLVPAAMLVCGAALLTSFVRKQLRSPQPMLDMGLFARPAISTGVVMALVVMGSLAGVELMLAQELQFVLGRSPLQAGVFMLPLMVASAIGGPLAGLALGRLGLRTVACVALVVSAASLAGLALSDLNAAGLRVPLLLGSLGLALSVGLTASSVAIMGSTPPEKAGSAGALEATSYDLGTGLGVAGFGLLLAAGYQKTLLQAGGVPTGIDVAATRSIGESLAAAQGLDTSAGAALEQAARQAFSASHSTVLFTAAAIIAGLSLLVWYVLRNFKSSHESAS